jgi:hypothetical protein
MVEFAPNGVPGVLLSRASIFMCFRDFYRRQAFIGSPKGRDTPACLFKQSTSLKNSSFATNSKIEDSPEYCLSVLCNLPVDHNSGRL